MFINISFIKHNILYVIFNIMYEFKSIRKILNVNPDFN